jgi:hypothetical protein
MRAILEFSAENAKIEDWLAERGGFEPPRPFRIRGAEFGPSLTHYSARIKAFVLERICSPKVWLWFWVSPVRFVRRVYGRCSVTSNTLRKLRVRISPSRADSQQLNSVSSELRQAVFASARARCAATHTRPTT